jgi:hypothetical protein
VSLQRCFQKAGFSTNDSTDNKTDESNIQELQESLNQATYENLKAEDYLNFGIEVETETDVKEVGGFTENRQQSEKEEDDGKEEEEDGTSQEQLELQQCFK